MGDRYNKKPGARTSAKIPVYPGGVALLEILPSVFFVLFDLSDSSLGSDIRQHLLQRPGYGALSGLRSGLTVEASLVRLGLSSVVPRTCL